MVWLYALHLRAPDSTVILVANKCDGSIDSHSETVRIVRRRVDALLARWHGSRGLASQHSIHLPTVNVLAETSKVSCQDGRGLADLADVITAQSSTSISVPPSWDLALVFLDALRDRKAPLIAARGHLNLPLGPSLGERISSDVYIPKMSLTRQWDDLLRSLTRSGELESTSLGMAAVLNSESALEGALSIRWGNLFMYVK